MTTWPEWDETEYRAYLAAERRCYIWTLRRYGDFTPAQAEAEADTVYAYEPSETPYRGLVFHDEAWHWAMTRIFGTTYTVDHPELRSPSPEYRALD